MRFKMVHIPALVSVGVLALGCTLWAQSTGVVDAANPGAESPSSRTLTKHTLNITVTGLIGPLLSGKDDLNLDGKKGKLTLAVSESLSPTKHTSTTATYDLPAGAIDASAGKDKLSTKSPSKMVIDLTGDADILRVIYGGPKGTTFTATFALEKGSWTTAVLKHPEVFTHSPQKVSSPGSQLKYTADGFTSVLGIDGTASNVAAVDAALPDDDASEPDFEQ